ncbi:MAG: DNA replication/repair protein RecF [Oscillospiraceae bacterium]
MSSCYVRELMLENYRNIKTAQLTFCNGVNIVTGENGQGKTNLLESIWLLTGAKSFRGSKDKDLINIGCDFARINSIVEEDDNKKTIDVMVANNETKKGRFARYNSSDMTRAVALAGRFYCVVFCPQHLCLVSGSPSLRRKFIDGALCQLYPGYIKTFKTFEKYLEQKNSLLKNFSKYNKREGEEILEIYNSKLGALGYEIYKKRREYIEILGQKASDYYSQLSAKREEISFEYLSFATQKEEFYDLLMESSERDKRAGFSTCGIQREDIEIRIDGISAKDFASQGQQRSIVLAMKLSESDILKEITHSEPVILLDDVLSELDFSRQEYLLHHIDNKQVFISSCDEERISLAKSKKYFVKNGVIRECM